MTEKLQGLYWKMERKSKYCLRYVISLFWLKNEVCTASASLRWAFRLHTYELQMCWILSHSVLRYACCRCLWCRWLSYVGISLQDLRYILSPGLTGVWHHERAELLLLYLQGRAGKCPAWVHKSALEVIWFSPAKLTTADVKFIKSIVSSNAGG